MTYIVFIIGVFLGLILFRNDGTKTCPFCKNKIKKGATICQYCHSALPPETEEKPVINMSKIPEANKTAPDEKSSFAELFEKVPCSKPSQKKMLIFVLAGVVAILSIVTINRNSPAPTPEPVTTPVTTKAVAQVEEKPLHYEGEKILVLVAAPLIKDMGDIYLIEKALKDPDALNALYAQHKFYLVRKGTTVRVLESKPSIKGYTLVESQGGSSIGQLGYIANFALQ